MKGRKTKDTSGADPKGRAGEEITPIPEEKSEYEDLYDFAPVGHFVLDSKALIRDVNLTGAEMLGVDRDQLKGRSLLEFILEGDRNAFRLHKERIRRSGTRQSCRIGLRNAAGAIFYAALESVPAKSGKGEESDPCFRVAAIDITEQRLAEAELEQYREHLESVVAGRTAEIVAANERLMEEIAERRRIEETLRLTEEFLREAYTELEDQFALRTAELKESYGRLDVEKAERRLAAAERHLLHAAIEQAGDAVLIADRDWTIGYANPSASAITGYSKQELTGMNVRVLFGRDPEQEGDVTPGSATRQPLHPFRMVRKGGAAIEVEANASPMEDREGTISNYVILLRDVTEKLRTERQMRQAQRMEAMGTLASGIAHDFNNILAGVIGFTEMVLEDVKPDDPMHRRLSLALKGSYRGRDLVHQILAFSRIKEAEFRPVAVGRIITEALGLLRPSILSTIEIRTRFTAESDVVFADPVQIDQVIMNLCTNASHAMREKGGVMEIFLADEELSAEDYGLHPELKPGRYLRLSVRDTGHGMSAEVMERIFDPFFTTKTPDQGTGMGLSVVHGIIKGHGGGIRVFSEPGRGSVFHILLRKVDSDSDVLSEQPRHLPGGNEAILFVDDEEILVEMNRQRLERLGYQVTAATDPRTALETFRQHPGQFDLVITDYAMPHVNGIDFIREICAIRPGMPVILCTGLAETEVRTEAARIGAQGVLLKPITSRDFAPVIRSILDSAKGAISS